MRICLLTNQDLLADPFAADDWPCDPRPFFSDAQWQVGYLRKSTAVEQITRRIRDGFDLFFNLFHGAADQGIPGLEGGKGRGEHGVACSLPMSGFYPPSR